MLWKRRMLAIFREFELSDYLLESSMPTPAITNMPSSNERAAFAAWKKKDDKVCTRIELAVNDAVMIHIISADMAHEMWSQLCTIHETKGRIGMIAARCALFQSEAAEDFDMKTHI